MYYLDKLTLINIGPYINCTYVFSRGTVIVVGENQTDEGQKNNGSGKSFILEGVVYALLGTGVRKVRDKDLIRREAKSGTIILELANSTGKTIKIEREIFSSSKSAQLNVAINGKQITDITSINEGNKYILSCLNLTAEDLLNNFLISKERYTSFFSSSDTSKKELINRFSKANKVDPIQEAIQEDIKHYTSAINKVSATIQASEAKLSVYKEQLEQFEDEIAPLKTQIDEAITLIESDRQSLVELEQLEQQAVLVQQEAAEYLKNSIASQNEIDDILKEYNKLLAEVDLYLAHRVECPNCSHTFSIKDATINIADLADVRAQAVESIKDTTAEKLLKEQEISSFRELEAEAAQALRKASGETYAKRSSIMANERVLRDLRTRLAAEIQSERKTKIEEAIQKGIRFIEDQTEELQRNKAKLQEAEEWLFYFKQFKGYLANQSLIYIQDFTNYYLSEFGSNITVRINGYTQLANGELREKISTEIQKSGVDVGSFFSLSGGEKARVEVAVILAIQKLININTQGLGLSNLILDEILESIDMYGLQSLVTKCSNLNLRLMLISQLDIPIESDKIVVVQKKEGVAVINQYTDNPKA